VAKFSDGTVDDYKLFVNVKVPTATIHDHHVPIQFGPWQTGHYTDAAHTTSVTDNIPLSWDDPGFAANSAETAATNPKIYGFGFTAPGPNGNTWTATVQNITPMPGSFYFVQTVNMTVKDTLENPLTNTKAVYSTSSGQVLYLDEFPNDGAGPKWAGKGGAVAVGPYSGPITIPAAGSISGDVNGNPINADFDNPHSLEISSRSNPLVLVSQNWDMRFATSVVFQAQGGIPVAIATDNWGFNVHENNATAAANPTFANAYLVQGNWTGSASSIPSTISTTPSLLRWSGNAPDASTAMINNPTLTPLDPALPVGGAPAAPPHDGEQSPAASP